MRSVNIPVRLIGLLIGLTAMQGCNKSDNTKLEDFKYDYYPTEQGHYVTYQVDSIRYSFAAPNSYQRDTVRYQLMEVVGDTFYDNLNELNYTIDLYRRATSLDSWILWKRWYLKPGKTNLQKNEDDIRFVRLVFPPKVNATWDGNLYVPKTAPYTVFQNWDYEYTTLDQPQTINGFTFDSTLSVTEVDDENLIEKTMRKSVYAKGVGLVYLEWEAMTKQQVNRDWITGPENGFRIRMRVIDFN